MKYITLSGNAKQHFPVVGLGTWQAKPQDIENVVNSALEIGYRHIDTAFNYNNEEGIGTVLQKWIGSGKVKREDLFITTKLPNIGNRAADVQRFLKLSLDRLHVNYVDLYLIHMPFGFVCDETTLTPKTNTSGGYEIDISTDHLAIWKAMEDQVRQGLTKNIGLSNFNSRQIRKVYDSAIIKPSVLQVELHAYMQQKELRKVCEELGIIVTAYASLGSPGSKAHFQNKYNYTIGAFPDLLGHPVIKEIAEKYNKSTGQILLRHLVQQNIVVIPKSVNPKRLEENISIFDFELNDKELKEIDSLDRNEEGRIFNFLFFKGIGDHPEYPFLKKNI